MKFSEELGVRIDSEVIELLKKAIDHAGNRRKLSMAINIGYTTIGNWLGVNEQKGEFITWEQWLPLKNYMATARLIAANNPRWMTPSEMRAYLEMIVNGMRSGEKDGKALDLSDVYFAQLHQGENDLSEDEKTLIESYRLANDAGKIAIMATAQAQAAIAKREESKPGEKAE